MPELSLQENISLAPYTTLKIGGPARWLLEAKTVNEIMAAQQWAAAEKVPVVVLGGGSNVLVSDQGFPGLAIICRNYELTWDPPHVVAGAGTKLGQLIAGAIQRNLGGLEWLIGVPGSVGGSVYGNAGTGNATSHIAAIGDYVDWVEVIDIKRASRKMSADECHFQYRHSIFKETKELILRVQLTLPAISADDERERLRKKAQGKGVAQPLAAASAGCMFKNPKVDVGSLKESLRADVSLGGTISAWRLVVAAGLQGYQLGQMQISPLHANFMVNLGGGTADQVAQLISYVKQQVRDKLGVQLFEEVQYLGFS